MINKLGKPLTFWSLTIFLVIFVFNFIYNNEYGKFIQPEVLAATNLSGRILLQVQDKGQAWYVNPVDDKRYFLGRPQDAFELMRSLGLGVSNSDINNFKVLAPQRLAGRILLQVEDKGQAYYVSPIDSRLYFLGRPADAFSVMRSQGLGITNSDLQKISLVSVAPVVNEPSLDSQVKTVSFQFKFQNTNYSLDQELLNDLYQKYSSATKVLSYSSAAPPANIRDAFYNIFLTPQTGDSSIDVLAAQLKKIATENAWSSDQLVEFSLALIQYIPYDHAKLSEDDNRNTNPYYPYETLFLNRGVCSDKTFLAVALLRKLGFGAAILDFPSSNHSAVGISCPLSDSVSGSGYCYAETTNYFPIGVVPQNISSGQAQTQSEFNVSFSSENLGAMEIYQAKSGLEYRGLTTTKDLVNSIKQAEADLKIHQTEITQLENEYNQKEAQLTAMKTQLDGYISSGQISAYNQLIPEYNQLVATYNAGLAVYRSSVDSYNNKTAEFNSMIKDFYQK